MRSREVGAGTFAAGFPNAREARNAAESAAAPPLPSERPPPSPPSPAVDVISIFTVVADKCFGAPATAAEGPRTAIGAAAPPPPPATTNGEAVRTSERPPPFPAPQPSAPCAPPPPKRTFSVSPAPTGTVAVTFAPEPPGAQGIRNRGRRTRLLPRHQRPALQPASRPQALRRSVRGRGFEFDRFRRRRHRPKHHRYQHANSGERRPCTHPSNRHEVPPQSRYRDTTPPQIFP